MTSSTGFALGGPWAITPAAADQVAEYWRAHLAGAAPERAAARGVVGAGGAGRVRVEDGVAVVPVIGIITPRASFLDFFVRTVPMDRFRADIGALAGNDRVRRILLVIDSPGGAVAGVAAAAEAVRRASQRKPVTAHIGDIGASAAYWIASQAGRVLVGRVGALGSVGAFVSFYDISGALDKAGVRAVVVRSGALKGAGAGDGHLSEEQLAELQGNVDAIAKVFFSDVGAGRKLAGERLAAVTDGSLHVGIDAVGVGLADDVESADDLLARLRREASAEIEKVAPPAPAGLRGRAAAERFHKLVEAELQKACTSGRAGIARVEEKYPALAAEAKKYGEEEERRDREADARRQARELEREREAAAAEAAKGKGPYDGMTAEALQEEYRAELRAAREAGARTGCEAMREVERRRPGLRTALINMTTSTSGRRV